MSFLTQKEAVKYVKPGNPAIEARINIERRIVASLIDELLAQGYTINVDNGGEEYEFATPSSERADILRALGETDEDRVLIYRSSGERIGWVRLVYGNDGWDVINDHTVNLEEDRIIPKTLALVDKLSN